MLKKKDYVKLSIVVLFYCVWAIGALRNSTNNRTLGVASFYRVLSGNTNLVFQLLFVMSLFVVIVCRCYKIQHHHFDDAIITRIGLWAYYKKGCRSVFVCTSVSVLVFHVVILLGILAQGYGLFHDDTLLFFSSMSLDMFCYIVLSAIGMGLFFLVLYASCYFIRNAYIFYALPAFVIFTSLILFTVLFSLFRTGDMSNVELIKSLFCMITPMNLFSPGMMFEGYGFVSFVSAFLLYGALFIGFSKWMITWRMRYG